jgi:hypothetical protein
MTQTRKSSPLLETADQNPVLSTSPIFLATENGKIVMVLKGQDKNKISLK